MIQNPVCALYLSGSSHWKAYPEYKDSGVEWLGEIPAGWDVDRLRFHVNVNPTKSELGALPPDLLVSFVPMEAVCEYGGIDLQQTKELEEVSSGYTYFKDGDVIVAKITPCFENGKGSIAEGLNNGIGFGTTELHVLRPLDDFDKKYLFYVTISHSFRNIGNSYMYGAGGQKRVPEDFIRNLMHPAPPLPEQKSIASFLDERTARIDAIVEKKERQIELLKEKRSALISRAVTKGLDPDAEMKDSGVEWLGEIPVGWDVGRLKYCCDVAGRIGFRGYTTEDQVDEGEGALTLGATQIDYKGDIDVSSPVFISWEKYYESPEIMVQKNNIIIVQRGSTCGKIGYISEISGHTTINPSVVLLKNIKFEPKFLFYYLYSNLIQKYFTNLVSSTAIPMITQYQIENIPLIEPSLSEMEEIISFLDRETARIDGLVEKVEKSVGMLREYRAALISAAVTGKIDVR